MMQRNKVLGETKQYKSNKLWGKYQPNKIPISSETSIVFKIIKHVTYLETSMQCLSHDQIPSNYITDLSSF